MGQLSGTAERQSLEPRGVAAPPVLGRADLIADLTRAVDGGSPRAVFVIFGFVGLNGFLEARTSLDGEALLDRLSARLTHAVRGRGTLYRPRRGEFSGLFEGELGVGWPAIPAALDEEASASGIHTAFATVVLPEQAVTPTEALRIADRRLRAADGDLRPQRD
jgi:hypothetical protein